jgi:hypothetical protein
VLTNDSLSGWNPPAATPDRPAHVKSAAEIRRVAGHFEPRRPAGEQTSPDLGDLVTEQPDARKRKPRSPLAWWRAGVDSAVATS